MNDFHKGARQAGEVYEPEMDRLKAERDAARRSRNRWRILAVLFLIGAAALVIFQQAPACPQ